MFVGEGPGYKEDWSGEPFHIEGKAGEELNRLCWQNAIDLNAARIDNLVRCRPPNNRDPKPAEIRECAVYLEESIKETNPEVLVPLGGFATRYLLGDVDLEMVNGIPHHSKKYDCIIYPIFHPAAGLRKPEIMLKTVAAFAYLKLLLKGETKLREHGAYEGLTLSLHREDDYAGKEDYKLITKPQEVYDDFYGDHWGNSNLIAIDTETVHWKAWCLSYSLAPGHGRVIMKDDQASIDVFKELVAHPDNIVLLHNALFDLTILKQMGIEIKTFRDTMIMAYNLQSEPQGLKPLAFRHEGMEMMKYEEVVNIKNYDKGLAYLQAISKMEWPNPDPIWKFNAKGEFKKGQPQNISKTVARILSDDQNPEKDVDIRERWKGIDKKKGREYVEDAIGPMPEGTIADISLEDAVFYACRDADATIRIYPHLLKKIESMGLSEVLDIDCASVPMVEDMQRVGMKILPDYLRGMSTYFEKKKAEYAIPLYSIMGRPFNIGSHKEIGRLLFDVLKLPQIKKRKTEAKVLMQLKGQHEAVGMLMKWRKYEKLRNTYSEKLPKFADKNDRVHASMKVTRTQTGRMSMSKPNLMAQPKRGEESKLIRKGFIAADGCYLVSGDYSQVELRVLAHMAGEEEMIKDFINGEDIHLNTAVRVFNRDPKDISDDQRRSAKIVNFGIPYGVQAKGLMEQIAAQGGKGWDYSKCQGLIDSWYQTYPKVHDYMIKTQQHAQRYGFVRDMWGRVRFVPSVKSANKWAQLKALREAGNMPIQAGAAGIIKKAMANLTPIYQGFRKAGFVCNPLIQIHDDLVFEVQKEIVEPFILCFKQAMEDVVDLVVPITIDPEVGKVWAKMQPADEYFEEIRKAA
jgi:uracil-DNA glycosylase family 4